MCVAALAWNMHPEWQLVAIGNRDELHARPALALHRWNDSPIIAGQDCESGGTWLGIGHAGTPAWHFALVTNLRSPDREPGTPRSRGLLVADCLTGETQPQAHRYNPFNLVTADAGGMQIASNWPSFHSREENSGYHALSNGPLDERWRKSEFLIARLRDWVENGEGDIAPLFDALARRSLPGMPPSPSRLSPETVAESPPFILDPVYGTRCSTICAIHRDGHGFIAERRFDGSGATTGETTISFPG